jgi:SAM-dependent methyltransferase
MSEHPDKPTDARARLTAHFKGDPSEHTKKWDQLWVEGFVPWDKGFPSPALVDLLEERTDLFPSKQGRQKALVPGCGRGYDVLLLSAFGYDAYGLEVSSKALEGAREVEKKMDGKGVYATKEGTNKGAITWITGDFFTADFLGEVEGESSFDLIYDYTVCNARLRCSASPDSQQFLSALPPSLRPAWSARLCELLAPKGRLVCLEFPTYKPPSTGGPPWALPPQMYLAHLTRPGDILPYGEDGELLESKLKEPNKKGLQRIAHFQPQRTHEIGYSQDGKVTDWIGVWRHPKPSN